MNGWTGKLLRVDLSARTARPEPLDRETLLREIGGRGLVGHLLAPSISLEWNHPDMPVVLAAGPLTGTGVPFSGRARLASRSPLTGALFDWPTGASLGVQLKRAGFDAVLVTGRADVPVGLRVTDGRAEIDDASHLVGRTCSQALRALGAAGSVAVTGPAAENGVRFAGISVDGCAPVRGGLGLCLAAKNLKYLAVKGSGRVNVADPAGLETAREDILRLTAASPALAGGHGFSSFGEAALFDLFDARGMTPTRNFRASRFAHGPELGAVALNRKFSGVSTGCSDCPVGCAQRAADGRLLPGCDALSHFTALLGLADLDLAVAAHGACLDLGLDPVSAAAVLAAHAELEGRDLAADQVLPLLDDMARGRAPSLARGAASLAEERRRPEVDMTVKGLEPPALDPRGAYGAALAMAVSTLGATQDRANPVSHEILRKPVSTDRFTFQGKARIIKNSEDALAAAECLTACPRALLSASLEEFAHAFQAVTGVEASALSLAASGERVCYRERILLARLGFSAQHDDLPARLFAAPGSSGADQDARPIPRQDFLLARSKYYALRGLDAEGHPTRETAASLGLSSLLSA
ncbi:aldehyde ferredoxin oxidoreductase family protein [Fundidesulfovibrio butyratiphilus]